MFVSKVSFYNYRNLADQSFEFHNGPVYITGRNGNGKTNLVEGIYLLSGSRSFRTNSQSELLKWGTKEASVFGSVVAEDGRQELGISFSPAGRKAHRNGDQLSSVSDLVGCCGVISFSPSDLSLVKGAPAGRRKFLDRHMVDLAPSFLSTIMGYQRALASKNSLLKQGTADEQQLVSWDELLTDYSVKLVDNRLKFIETLFNSARSFHSQFAESDGELELLLESDFMSSEGVMSPAQVKDRYQKARSRELMLRSSVIGPHKDDIAITLSGIDSRAYASQGQSRSIVLALKLGVIDMLQQSLGEAPIIILDDVDSELDESRTELLYKALVDKKRQVFITGTEKPSKKILSLLNTEVQVVSVEAGDIKSN